VERTLEVYRDAIALAKPEPASAGGR